MARNKLWGRHRRRHIRNETLTMVWNYTSNAVKGWFARATGAATAEHQNRYRLIDLREWLRQSVINSTTNDNNSAAATAPAEKDLEDPEAQNKEGTEDEKPTEEEEGKKEAKDAVLAID